MGSVENAEYGKCGVWKMHIQRKNPMFDGQVFIESAVYRALGVNQIEVLKQYDLNINICN